MFPLLASLNCFLFLQLIELQVYINNNNNNGILGIVKMYSRHKKLLLKGEPYKRIKQR